MGQDLCEHHKCISNLCVVVRLKTDNQGLSSKLKITMTIQTYYSQQSRSLLSQNYTFISQVYKFNVSLLPLTILATPSSSTYPSCTSCFMTSTPSYHLSCSLCIHRIPPTSYVFCASCLHRFQPTSYLFWVFKSSTIMNTRRTSHYIKCLHCTYYNTSNRK